MTIKKIFLIASIFIITSCSRSQDVIINESITSFIEVYVEDGTQGNYVNNIVYREPEKSEVVTQVESLSHIYHVFLDQENEVLFGLSDLGLYQIDFKNGTFETISKETATSMYNKNNQLYYHLNIGSKGDVYVTEICKLETKDCNTFEYYVSSYYLHNDEWFIVERNQNYEKETFTLHIYDLDFNIISENQLIENITDEPPIVTSVNSNLYYIYDSGIILNEDNEEIYKTDYKIFTIESKINEKYNSLVISLMDKETHEIVSHEVIDLDDNTATSLPGNGFIFQDTEGIQYRKDYLKVNDNSTYLEKTEFFYYSFSDRTSYEVGEVKGIEINKFYIAIIPLIK